MDNSVQIASLLIYCSRIKRGTHNIEREMEFKDNPLFVVHDSEGFEAGQDDEFRVVTNFIESRARMKNIDDRLHAIW